MSIINHCTATCRQPRLPSKKTEAQDSIPRHPTALIPFPGTQFQKPPPQTPNRGISDIAASLKDAGFTTKKRFSGGGKGDYTHPVLQSLFMGPLVELPEESVMADQGAAKVVLAVSVSSAVELDERQVDLIARKMKRMTGFCNLRMENTVDSSLIAGFVISFGDDESHVIDLSVKGQLAALATRVESSDR
ncbi:hypothetical protein KSP39_PZI006752 [Platanthera zijinensis]|uniref:ATP synthase delta chain, chloroplastic n=1 Tax=Platanthera zijinensis TaxID=2320716 RepID=A0AAP0G987_9ASPA